jgi:uncharacterized protein YdhG (YjbR/CyaY superfamily)
MHQKEKLAFYGSVMPMQAGYDLLDKYCSGKHNHFMIVIDDFLTTVEPSKRQELERIRALAKQTVPAAEEAIVYGMPTLTYQGKPFLGFDAHKQHIGIYPYSGQVLETLKDQLHDSSFSKGAIRVPLDHPISEEMLKQIIHPRLLQITPS